MITYIILTHCVNKITEHVGQCDIFESFFGHAATFLSPQICLLAQLHCHSLSPLIHVCLFRTDYDCVGFNLHMSLVVMA